MVSGQVFDNLARRVLAMARRLRRTKASFLLELSIPAFDSKADLRERLQNRLELILATAVARQMELTRRLACEPSIPTPSAPY
jgi:hypothetical protein